MQLALRIGTVIMGLLFVLAAAVQYNDPDPIVWIVMYGAAAASCVLFLLKRPLQKLAIVTGAVALVWAALLLPRVLGQVEPGALFQETGMATLEIEEARETLGLMLVAVWMAVLAVASRRKTSKQRVASR